VDLTLLEKFLIPEKFCVAPVTTPGVALDAATIPDASAIPGGLLNVLTPAKVWAAVFTIPGKEAVAGLRPTLTTIHAALVAGTSLIGVTTAAVPGWTVTTRLASEAFTRTLAVEAEGL
jgi:hypothetical protein